MDCGYRGWIIDATPNFSFGKFFAHARLVRAATDDDIDREMHIERNLSWFDTEEEAIEVAQQWAFAWIGNRESSFSKEQTGTQPAEVTFRHDPGQIKYVISRVAELPSG
jgi:hypothetical protein